MSNSQTQIVNELVKLTNEARAGKIKGFEMTMLFEYDDGISPTWCCCDPDSLFPASHRPPAN
jgi:hypothetical protein